MNALATAMDHLLIKRRWVIHLFYWTLVLAFYVVFFGRRNSNYLQTAFFVALILPVTITTAYFFNYFLVPNYLMKERYMKFLTYSLYTVLGSLTGGMMVALLTFLAVAELRTRNMSPASFDVVFLLTSMLMVVFLSVAIKMVLHWRQSKDEYQLLMRDKIEAELKFLKTQLNPHFLFNTLNNLYFLSTEKSDKTPQAILALSEILDYVLHSGSKIFVPLREEIKQVENYISLELMRYEDRVVVEKEFLHVSEEHIIPPMLVMTLVENAFKHGAMQSAAKSWIRIFIESKSQEVMIVVSNSYVSSRSGNGIGLDNLKSQLNHLYKDMHVLEIDRAKEGEFVVTLKLFSR